MSTYNIFHGELIKNVFQLSSNTHFISSSVGNTIRLGYEKTCFLLFICEKTEAQISCIVTAQLIALLFLIHRYNMFSNNVPNSIPKFYTI